jgi:hypothetical protein
MASTINAQVTPFAAIVQEADGTGVLALQTANVTALTISSSQIVSLTNALPASSGGTGLASPGTSGNVLTSNGTAWTSAPAAAFDSGTKMLFQQTAAPTGWTKDTTHDNKALRVVSGTAGSGGSVAFTTAFASQAVNGTVANTGSTTQGGTVGATTLTTTQIPAHGHTFSGNTGTISADHTHFDYGHVHSELFYSATGGGFGLIGGPNNFQATRNTGTGYASLTGVSANHVHSYSGTTANAGSGGSHDHTFTGAGHTHTSGAFTGTAINLAVSYVDLIIASKD